MASDFTIPDVVVSDVTMLDWAESEVTRPDSAVSIGLPVSASIICSSAVFSGILPFVFSGKISLEIICSVNNAISANDLAFNSPFWGGASILSFSLTSIFALPPLTLLITFNDSADKILAIPSICATISNCCFALANLWFKNTSGSIYSFGPIVISSDLPSCQLSIIDSMNSVPFVFPLLNSNSYTSLKVLVTKSSYAFAVASKFFFLITLASFTSRVSTASVTLSTGFVLEDSFPNIIK